MNRLLILLLTGAIVGGCAVGKDYKSPDIPLPSRYINQTEKGVWGEVRFDGWWREFGDTTLNTIIELAIDSNRELEIAMLSVEQARLTALNAGKALLPTFSIDGSADITYQKSTGVEQTYTAAPKISWEVDIWGELRREREAQRAALLSTQWAARAVYLEVVSSVLTNYFGLLESRALFAISDQTLKLRLERLELMQKMYSLGAISKLDYNTADNLALTAAITLEGYRADINSYQRALNALLGSNPTPIATPSEGFAKLKTPNHLPELLPIWIIENRPDVMEQYANLMQSNAEIGVAIAKKYPSLTLSAQGGILHTILKSGASSSTSFMWGSVGSIIGTLFSWNKLNRNVEIAKLENRADYYSLEQTILNALKEVETTLGDISALESQIKDMRKLVEINIETAEMTESLYRAGAVDYLSLLDAQRELFLSQQSYVTTQSERLNAYVTLYKSIGAGY